MYHKLSIDETLRFLDVNQEIGLSDKEARERRAGALRGAENSSFLKFAAGAISRPVIYMLASAAVLSALLGGFFESALIIAVIILNALFSAHVRRRAHKSISEAVNASVTHATVLRNGAKMVIPSDELVVGDIITLKPGRVVPADVRLISTERLLVDESALSGGANVRKDAEIVLPGSCKVSLRSNCAFEGTVVLKGRGDGVVVATGMSTELSHRARLSDTPERDSATIFKSTNKTLSRANKASALLSVAVFIASLAYKQPFFSAVLLSLSLACAIIPESLVTASLTALSKGAESLKQNGFLAKTMKSIEALGDTDVFIADVPSLGVFSTYTNGRVHTPQEEDTVPFIDGLLLCDGLDPSLSAFAVHKCNEASVREAFPKIGELSGRVYTSLHRAGGTTVSYTGGDADEILSRSELIWDFGKIRKITDFDLEEMREEIRALTEEGYRLTALGMRSGDDVPCDTGLIFLGFAATSAGGENDNTPDIKKLERAGVKTYLLTCDSHSRAALGASVLGIPHDNIIMGYELQSLDDSALSRALPETFVFAGLSPDDKVRIINTLKNLGKTVCTLGEKDGDAAALAAADTGLSGIRAKDVAKNSSDIIFSGESAADTAIYCGKITKSAAGRASSYICASNLAEAIGVSASVFLGFGFPMSALQILLINLITDTFPVFALSRTNRSGKASKKLLYTLGAVSGLLTPVIFKLCESFLLNPSLSGWITFAFLTGSELLLCIPAALSGRDKNGM